MRTLFRSRAWLWLGFSWVGLGCSYDFDPLYEHPVADAGAFFVAPDTGTVLPTLSSAQLIQSWIGNDELVDADCVSCAEQKCASADADCRADPGCLAYTQCVGAAPNPAGQTACRVTYESWVRKDVRAHDLSGPYGQCVFKYNCAAECGGNDDLSCLHKYTWPSTPAATIPLHLYLSDAVQQTAPIANAKVAVCAAGDLKCGNPGMQGTSDATGLVELQLPTTFSGAFTGYLMLEGDALYPSLIRFSWNIGQETTYLLNTVNKQLFNQAIGTTGISPDDKRGMVQARMLGCGGVGLRGASFQSDKADAQSATWYIDTVPKINLTTTNSVGSGGIVNLPEGNTTVTATRASDGALLGTTNAPVRAGYMTVVVFAPESGQ